MDFKGVFMYEHCYNYKEKIEIDGKDEYLREQYERRQENDEEYETD
jgi:hypothetical protein